jgi:hypothetical protein
MLHGNRVTHHFDERILDAVSHGGVPSFFLQ